MQSVYGLTPITQAAKDWIKENVQAESWQWLGHTLVIEHRYISDIVQGMVDDGLVPNTDFQA